MPSQAYASTVSYLWCREERGCNQDFIQVGDTSDWWMPSSRCEDRDAGNGPLLANILNAMDRR